MADGLAPFSRSLMEQRAVARSNTGVSSPKTGLPPKVSSDREYGSAYHDRTQTLRESVAPHGGNGSNAHPEARDPEAVLRLILLVIIGVLGLVVLVELGFQLLVAPQMHIQRISLDSDLDLTRETILAAGGISANELFYAIDPAAVEARLRSLPAVEDAKVELIFPDTLSIKLHSRQALMVSLIRDQDGRQVPVLIDAMGQAFHVGLLPLQDELPVLTGIEFRNFRPGLQLPRSVVPFLQDLQNLRLQDPALFHAFSEFRLIPVGTGQVEIMAYTIQSAVGVRINARLSQEGALYILRTLDMIARTEGMTKIREIDFRTNNVVYKKGDN